MGQTESNSWGFLDVLRGGTYWLTLGRGRSSPAAHNGVCLGEHGSPAAARAGLRLRDASLGPDAELDAAIVALPGHATGPFPGVTGAQWWATVDVDERADVRAWLRRKAVAVIH